MKLKKGNNYTHSSTSDLVSLLSSYKGFNIYKKTMTLQTGQGDGVGFNRGMTRVKLNLKFHQGEHAIITLKKDDSNSATTSKSINEIFGQMLVSHNVRT